MNDTQNALAQDEKARKWVQNKQSLSLYIPSPVLSITPGIPSEDKISWNHGISEKAKTLKITLANTLILQTTK